MSLQSVPLLKTQQELLLLPKSQERFDAYLQAMTGGTDDILIPIGAFNPMAKEHVAGVIDHLLKHRAEEMLTSVLEDFKNCTEDLRVGLVVVDDVMGGWTCRETIELERLTAVSGELKRKWVTVFWWCGDPCTPEAIRREMVAQIFKSLAIVRGGPVQTLRELVELEAQAMQAAGEEQQAEDYEWLPKFESLLSTSDVPTLISAFYGDAAAEKLGYEKLGFPRDAGRLVAAKYFRLELYR